MDTCCGANIHPPLWMGSSGLPGGRIQPTAQMLLGQPLFPLVEMSRMYEGRSDETSPLSPYVCAVTHGYHESRIGVVESSWPSTLSPGTDAPGIPQELFIPPSSPQLPALSHREKLTQTFPR